MTPRINITPALLATCDTLTVHLLADALLGRARDMWQRADDVPHDNPNKESMQTHYNELAHQAKVAGDAFANEASERRRALANEAERRKGG